MILCWQPKHETLEPQKATKSQLFSHLTCLQWAPFVLSILSRVETISMSIWKITVLSHETFSSGFHLWLKTYCVLKVPIAVLAQMPVPIFGLPNSDCDSCPWLDDSSMVRCTLGDSRGPKGISPGYTELLAWLPFAKDPLKKDLSTDGPSLDNGTVGGWDCSAKNEAFITWMRCAFMPSAVANWWLAGELSISCSSMSLPPPNSALSSSSSSEGFLEWKTCW